MKNLLKQFTDEDLKKELIRRDEAKKKGTVHKQQPAEMFY